MEKSKLALQEKAKAAATGRQKPEIGLPPLLADFLKGKGGQTGCKRRNFKKAKKPEKICC